MPSTTQLSPNLFYLATQTYLKH